jgi:hypothetical protein
MKKTLLFPIALCGALLLNGCVAAIGNRDQDRSGTLGQQLIDLKKAREAGALSDSEYETQRARMLRHN